MDAVQAFNAEMVSMMDMKPPISRAKMMSITKAGIKAIKLYKHVVQIIEKFIKRCGPELKVPGLYVVDSIIRQSRHQFGEDKDVFGPRFLKNISETFHSLYQCPPDDKTKILRVLNLWQKNSVFGMDVIQPLLDMASAPLLPVLENGRTLGGSPAAEIPAQPPSASIPVTLDQPISTGVLPETQISATFPQLQNPAALPQLQIPRRSPTAPDPGGSPSAPEPGGSPSAPEPGGSPTPPEPHPSPTPPEPGGSLSPQNPTALPHLQNPAALPHLQNPAALPHLQNPAALPQLQNPVAFPQHQNPPVLTAIAQFLQSSQGLDLQQVLQTLQQSSANAQPAAQSAAPSQPNSTIAKVLLDRFDYDEEPDVEEPKQEETTPAVNLMDLQQALQAHLFGQLSSQVLPNVQAALQAVGSQSVPGSAQAAGQPRPDLQPSGPFEIPRNENHGHVSAQPQDVLMESSQSRRDDRDGRYNRRSRSRSPRRRSSSRTRRSRSGSRSHRSRFRRSRSRSRERWRGSPRSRTEDRRERERKHKGLPPIRRETLSVCTTTLWIGQLDKKTQQQDISSLMEEFGQIESINMIPPRGCAYIVMVHRQDASTALNKLSRGSARINHKPFKIAWALNKGVSSRFKKYWDVELGVTYVPWSKLKPAEIPALRDGGMLDQDTFNPEWASVLEDLLRAVEDKGCNPEGEPSDGAAVALAGPQVPAVSVDVAGSPAAITPTMISPPHTHAADKLEAPSAEPCEGPVSQMDSPEAPVTSSLPAGTLPGPLQHPPGPLPPFIHPFPNNVRPNMPPVNMPRPNIPRPNAPHPNAPHPNVPHPNMPPMHMAQPTMPQGPMFRERPPGPPGPPGPMGPRGPRGPPGRFRMPMPGPHEDFPPPGPMEGDHWNRAPLRNDWRHSGPNRGPEWFEEGPPPFRRGGWARGGPRGRGHFAN
ncbi:LOW QUALITY PROTEIN: SR-related and CTD-associated factor 4-like [Colossoma macropomum]|uniref:LOW QUALITY PROTEIN: SR-related and CTD-associated factor 4-like n=1 Tax=Colossoma macropomum TaxID=42526 RepID=UPI00186569B9|nr:LOW QUALITY PROTEIN: SR-related and CTD-associated factor 4-like [Colossoma macropomum]